MGVRKGDRDLIRRWLPEGSDQYVRTYNAAAARLQKKFVRVVRSGEAYTAFDEGSMLEELKERMVAQWEVDPERANNAVEAFKKKEQVLSAVETADKAQQPMGGEETDVAVSEFISGKSSEICAGGDNSAGEKKGKKKKAKADHMEKAKLAELVEKGKKKGHKERRFQHLAEERQGGYMSLPGGKSVGARINARDVVRGSAWEPHGRLGRGGVSLLSSQVGYLEPSCIFQGEVGDAGFQPRGQHAAAAVAGGEMDGVGA